MADGQHQTGRTRRAAPGGAWAKDWGRKVWVAIRRGKTGSPIRQKILQRPFGGDEQTLVFAAVTVRRVSEPGRLGLFLCC